MTTRTFPSLQPARARWELIDNARQYVSPHTGAIQTEQRSGQRWLVTLEFRNLASTDRTALQAFVGLVVANSDNFTMPAFGHYFAGAGGGTPLVNGADQTGTSLVTDGWPVSTAVIKAGDMFEVGNELKMATEDGTSDGSGNLTISIYPEIHNSPADNASISTSSPTGVFRFVPGSTSWDLSPRSASDSFADLTLTCVEDVLA